MIGPHEKRELELMLAGTKPAAIITDPSTIRKFKAHKQQFLSRHGTFTGDRGCFWVYAQPGEEKRLARLVEIFSSPDRPHREIGELLGYSKEDIDHFIRRMETLMGV